MLYLLNNKQSESGIDRNHKKFNPLRAKADSFGFRRGYFLKSKKMELAEVKKHFENAEFVETKTYNEKRKVDLDSIWADCDLDFWSIEKETGYIFYLGSKKKGLAKILTTKEPSFSITKDQLRQLTDPKVKEWFPEVFEVKLEVGKWYKYFGNLCVYNRGKDTYGFWNGEFRNNISFSNFDFEDRDIVKATNVEVFEALKKEAVKRGFDKGITFQGLDCKECTLEGTSFLFKKNILYASDGFKHIIFKNGKWATIIQTITKSEAEKLLNKKIID